MRVRILSILCAMVLSVGMSGVSIAGGKCKGEVKSIEGNTLVINCQGGEEMKVTVDNPGDYKAGDKVEAADGKVKKAKKKVEGC
ncbi:MAG: hypothetical protein K6360_05950 [Deltaproteobacteria bacterium]